MYMIQYNHAKLLRQCVLFWPRNRFARERMTAPADTTLVDPSIGGGGGGGYMGLFCVRRPKSSRRHT